MTAASLELSSLSTRTDFLVEGLPETFDPTAETPEEMGARLTERTLDQAHTKAELGKVAFNAGHIDADELAGLDRQVEVAVADLHRIIDEDPDRIDGKTIVRGTHF